MSEQSKHDQPYKVLGTRLKGMREKLHESVAEVSGAVEIDPDTLVDIERGERCPSEDVLLLLISYFNFQEEEAVQLWELAGYEEQDRTNGGSALPNTEETSVKPMVMLVQPDNRIMYTDTVNVTINKHGVVMNFMQNPAIPDAQPAVIARMGMSREHAKSVLEVLQQTLAQTEPTQKSLPAPRKTTDETA
jgi:DNA-binding XRE family transcriptional regulator